jgi:hypothetical protein
MTELAHNSKTCTSCKQSLPATREFFFADKSRPGGLYHRCKSCRARLRNLDADRKWNKKWRASRREQLRDYDLKRRYGISLKEYSEMLAAQNGCCAVCKEQSDLVVDHCHETGKVRSLLCNSCNRSLGLLKEDPTRIMRLADYARMKTV